MMALPLAGSLMVPGAAWGASTAQASASVTHSQGHPWLAPEAIVTLGDSYIAGEAGRWKGNSADPAPGHAGTDRAFRTGPTSSTGTADPTRIYGSTSGACDRSDVAPVLSARLPFVTPINLACSGARTENVLRASAGGVAYLGEAPQNDQLAQVAVKYRVRLIALSIGGNDLGFGPTLQTCIAAYLFKVTPCSTTQSAVISQRLPGVRAKVEAVIADVRATMAAAGYRPRDYRLVLQSYPSPLATARDMRYPESDPRRASIGGCPFYDADADWTGKTLIPHLRKALAKAASSTKTQFLDLTNALAGHQLCSERAVPSSGRPRSSTNEWVRFIDLTGQGTFSESLHPNYFGQRALGRCLALTAIATARKPRDLACRARAGKPAWAVRIKHV
jgi:hypothetical protein